MAKLAVFFPGIGYHCDKPLLYYGRDVACEAGYDKYINIKYEYPKFDIRDVNSMREAAINLLAQAHEQLKDVKWDEYEEVVFIAKSIGTTLAANYADELKLPNMKLVLLTPLVYTYQWEIKNAVAFIGSRDQFSTLEDIQKLSDEHKVPLYVYDGCNHSLECDDTFKNLDIMKEVMKIISDFIKY